jgi:hypothetical protein
MAMKRQRHRSADWRPFHLATLIEYRACCRHFKISDFGPELQESFDFIVRFLNSPWPRTDSAGQLARCFAHHSKSVVVGARSGTDEMTRR